MDAHDGTIEFASEEGRGTTFRVRLPFASSQTTNGAVQERGTETVV